jgi:hypothetical protein
MGQWFHTWRVAVAESATWAAGTAAPGAPSGPAWLGSVGASSLSGVSDMHDLQTGRVRELESQGIKLKKVHMHACGSHALHEHSVTELGCIWQ